MSHHPERKEKNCLNCGNTVAGRYCQRCGQENIEPKESFWHLVMHFFSDLTHFDGKFFTTLKDLLIRPGFLSRQYMIGRRTSYLNPIRMYVFTSAIFFLIYFSVLQGDEAVTDITVNGQNLDQINRMDSASFSNFTANINKGDKKPAVPMTRNEFKHYIDSSSLKNVSSFGKSRYHSRKEYDSLIALGKVKDGWLQKQFTYKQLQLSEKYKNDEGQIIQVYIETLRHSFPQMMFISLPLLALVFLLLYIRRKQFYYVNHFIFSIHLYVFLLFALFVFLTLTRLNHSLHWGFLTFFNGILIFGMFIYVYLAQKNFYHQGWLKTFFKFLLLIILYFIVLVFLMLIFLILSFFKI